MKKVLWLLCTTLLWTCGDGLTSNKFSNLPAYFSFTPVASAPVLFTSLNSPGEWCTITLDQTGKRVLFAGTARTDTVNLTALQNYQRLYLGLSGGLIAGLPNVPELGQDQPAVTCYDLACRNCYEERNTTPRLKLTASGTARCTRCQRAYNLNAEGLVSEGTAGKALLRYRIYYNGGNAVAVSNP
ncbi:MAG: hypothetical protein SPF56_05910 [Bacteroidaceae bacterium]|nr:hypothetical protein [Bacteroidaceae bacterium]